MTYYQTVKYYSFCIAFSMLVFSQFAFAKPPQPEKIYVHLDKSFYVAGESINFKVYFLNKNKIESELVHVEIVDSDNLVKINRILKISNNSASGKFILPISFEEGNYLFRCYTAWNINFGNNFIFNKIIPVFNEWKDENSIFQDASLFERDTNTYSTYDSNGIVLKIMNTDPISTGDSIHVEIDITDNQQANLSMSVIDLNLINPRKTDYNSDYFTDLSSAEKNIEIIYNPEKSIFIQGKVFDISTNQPITSRVLSIYNVRNADFSRLMSADGDFSFELPVFTGDVDLQIINMNPFEDKVTVVKQQPLISNDLVTPFSNEAERTPEVKKYLYYSKLRRQIDEVFFIENKDSLQLRPASLLPFIPDRSYDMEKYRMLKNLEDFVRQGVINATSYKEDGQTKLKLFNIETKQYFMTKPWLIVDNHFVFNDSLAYNIPFNHLKRVDIFITNKTIFKYFEPIMIQGGVIAVYTKNDILVDYIQNTPNTLSISGISSESFRKVNNTTVSISEEIPEFNPVIYWNPEISTDANGKARFSFLTNNVTGNCQIQIQGIDKNGTPIEGKVIYKVFP